jgi:hypothetical protein
MESIARRITRTARRLLKFDWVWAVHAVQLQNLNLQDGHDMKIQQTVLISALLLGSGVAMAAGNGGGGQASDAAVTAASSGSMSSSSTTHAKKKSTKTTKRPANDTTQIPGADAASDTKGQ